MNLAIQKTLAFILLIVIGLLLKKKLLNREQLGGIKMVILSIALPATIFVALLKIDVAPELLGLPILALAFNFIMLIAASWILPVMGITKESPQQRTLMLLIPSLAPGLSCFPFIVEYLGEETLAWAALADVGNKVFVLVFLYLLAMHWYYHRKKINHKGENNNRLKELLLSLVREPVNLVIILALVLLSLGLSLSSLPTFLQSAVERMSGMMTPLVLLFIGLAVRLRKGEFFSILSLLLWRSGIAFCLSAFFLLLFPNLSFGAAMLAVIFPQSACSFWPYAHMAAVASLEKNQPKNQTFDIDLGLNMLAFSLPFSTILILAICTSGKFFTQTTFIIPGGLALIVLSVILLFINGKTKPASIEQKKQGLSPSFSLETQDN